MWWILFTPAGQTFHCLVWPPSPPPQQLPPQHTQAAWSCLPLPTGLPCLELFPLSPPLQILPSPIHVPIFMKSSPTAPANINLFLSWLSLPLPAKLRAEIALFGPRPWRFWGYLWAEGPHGLLAVTVKMTWEVGMEECASSICQPWSEPPTLAVVPVGT